jgi:hypothetical protein
MSELPRAQDNKTALESHFGFRETPFGVTPIRAFFTITLTTPKDWRR